MVLAPSVHDCSSRKAMVRSTPLTKPARAESNSMPACSTVVDTAACASTRVRSSWYVPSRSRSSSTELMFSGGRPAARAMTASSSPRVRHVP